MKKLTYVEKTQRAAHYIRSRYRQKAPSFIPHIALTLGSGLDVLEKEVRPILSLESGEIPYFPKSTVAGHAGRIVIGYLEKVPLIFFSGRVHYYEFGKIPEGIFQVVFPVHFAANLGCRIYMATNAAGGLNKDFNVGDLMLVNSHISSFLPNPLIGPHLEFGNNLYFQPMHGAYSNDLQTLFHSAAADVIAAEQSSINVHSGVYAAVSGRTYETTAECMMLRTLGADAVGMSTVPEIITATNRGMDTLAVSLITNVIDRDGTNKTTHEEVTATLSDEKRSMLITNIFRNFFTLLHDKKIA